MKKYSKKEKSMTAKETERYKDALSVYEEYLAWKERRRAYFGSENMSFPEYILNRLAS